MSKNTFDPTSLKGAPDLKIVVPPSKQTSEPLVAKTPERYKTQTSPLVSRIIKEHREVIKEAKGISGWAKK